jgi:hypothetical protein
MLDALEKNGTALDAYSWHSYAHGGARTEPQVGSPGRQVFSFYTVTDCH